jgi:hypothetical protein
VVYGMVSEIIRAVLVLYYGMLRLGKKTASSHDQTDEVYEANHFIAERSNYPSPKFVFTGPLAIP